MHLLSVFLVFILVSCDDSKTIEGSVWEKSVAGTVLRLPGSEVRLLEAKVKDGLKKHLKSYDGRISQAINSNLVRLINEKGDSLKREEEGLRKVIEELSETISRAKIDVESAVENEKKQKQIYENETGPLQEEKKNLNFEKTSLISQIDEQRKLLANAQAEKDKKYSLQKVNLEAKLEEKKLNAERARHQCSPALKALKKENDTKLDNILKEETSALTKLSNAKIKLSEAQRKYAESLKKKYIDNKITVSSVVTGTGGTRSLCLGVRNNGDKAVHNVVLDILYNGKSLRAAGINLKELFLVLVMYGAS